MKKRLFALVLFLAALAVFAAAPEAAPAPLSRQVYLPPRLYAVEGQELNIYFANLSVFPLPGAVEVVAKVGAQFADRYRFIPGPKEVGTHKVRLEWRDVDGKLLAEAETVIEVAPAKPAEPKSLTLLMVGDSLTNATYYPRRIVEALRADGFTVATIGSHAGRGAPAGEDGVVHEGYGGWQFSTFLTRWTNQKDFRAKSPFLTAPGKLDIPAYFAKRGGKLPDVITVMLGVNDIARCTRDTLPGKLDEIAQNADKLIGALEAAAPQAKIGIAIIPPPASSQDAFGDDYKTGINRAQYLRNVFALWQLMEKKYRNHPRWQLIPASVNLDCVNNYATAPVPFNAHNPQKHPMQNNAVHPAPSGYRQIGDSFYFWIRSAVK